MAFVFESEAPRESVMLPKRDERWVGPLPVEEECGGCSPWRYRGSWEMDNADSFRHIHCLYYERCLTAACKNCKGSETWACLANCTGRLTFVEFEPVSVRLMNN